MGKHNLPQILTAAEEERLLSQFNTRYFVPARNMMMIKIGLQTGMRVSEIINLKFSDITPAEGAFRVHVKDGKGGKDRILFIGPTLFEELMQLHTDYGIADHVDWVFPTHKGTPLKASYLRRMIKDKGEKAGVPRVHFHLLRHTYLTKVYDRTKDIRVTQEIAGHASISTTMIYTHVQPAAVRRVMV